MLLYDRSTEFVFLKTSNLNAQRLYIRFKRDIFVSAFVKPYYSDKSALIYSLGIPVLSFEEFWKDRDSKFPNAKLVIFEPDESRLKELIAKLSAKKLHFYEDYIWWENLIEPHRFDYIAMQKKFGSEITPASIRKYAGQRKICFIHGNFQTGILKKYLFANPIFKNRYMLLNLPETSNWSAIGIEIDPLLSIMDLILTQPIESTNQLSPKISTEYLRQNMKKDARCIVFPLLNFAGYFPQYSLESKHVTLGKVLVSYGDANIDRLNREGYSVDQIVETLSKDDFYSDTCLFRWFEQKFNEIESRDKDCDVKMSDWIRLNYSKEILFHSFNHPKESVVRELASRILNYLGIFDKTFEDEFIIERTSNMHMQEQPIYPSVRNYLKIRGGGGHDSQACSPNLFAANWRFNFKDYVKYYVNSLQGDQKLTSQRLKRPSLSIWGSCVSREILNYTNDIDLKVYILQNPIQTLFFEPFEIDESDIKATSNFAKRMLMLETRKQSRKYFVEHSADWLMLDTCDCRCNFWRLKSNHNVRICDSSSSNQTIKGSKYQDQFELVSIFEISKEDWQIYTDQFCEFVLSLYPMERIILNEFRFAKYFWKDGKLSRFPNANSYDSIGKITKYVEELIKQRMPRIHVITPEIDTIADYYHHIGCSTMHFLDEIYMRQLEKLNKIIFS